MTGLDREDLNESSPLVSVILPVFNGADTIAMAISSILDQTYTNYEFVIINDGSTDNTQLILESFSDRRIKILRQENRGLVLSLNRGILASKGKYLARIDADDTAVPHRLEKQVEFLENNPSVALVGSAIIITYENGKKRLRRFPPDRPSILKNIIRINPFSHSAVMIRRAVLDNVGLYDVSKDGSKRLLVEDYDLWVRMIEAKYELANLPDALVHIYRLQSSILGQRSLGKKVKQQILSRIDAIRRLKLGPLAYINIIPVVILSAISYFGIKLDGIFNSLSSSRTKP